MLAEVSVTEQILREFPKLSMHKQCVPALFFPPTHEPGNEANGYRKVTGYHLCVCVCV